MEVNEIPFSELLSHVADNRGRTCPTAASGRPLIATNCISNDRLYPSYDTERFVSEDTYNSWFRSHPLPDDIIFVCKGSPGRAALAPEPVDFCIAQDMVAVRANCSRIYPKYLFAALRSQLVQDRIANMHVGTLIPHFKKGDFDKLPIPVPDRATQELIGDTYYELSAKIEQNRRTSAALERLARAIFRAWFVDFEPVKAKASGAISFPSMPQTVFDALPTRFADSELGAVPEGWEVSRWGELITLEYGKGLRGYRDAAGQYRVFGTNGPIGWHAERLVDGPGIIVGRKGAYRGVHYSPAAFWVIDTAFFVTPKQDLDMKWAYYEILRADINSMDSGSAIPSTSREDFYAIPVCVPNPTVMRAFHSMVNPLFDLNIAFAAEDAKHTTLRDYLLPKLLSGEVRICEAERSLAEAV